MNFYDFYKKMNELNQMQPMQISSLKPQMPANNAGVSQPANDPALDAIQKAIVQIQDPHIKDSWAKFNKQQSDLKLKNLQQQTQQVKNQQTQQGQQPQIPNQQAQQQGQTL